jgi:signal transduction histidine kinase
LWFHSTLVPVNDSEGRIEYIIVVSMNTTDRQRAEQQVLNHQAQLKSLASELVLAEERERDRLATHLHDNVCQNLAFSKMKLQMVQAVLADQVQLDDMREVSDTLTRMMQEIRTLTFELSSPLLTEFGLEAAISHWLTEQVEQRHSISVGFNDDGQTKPLEDDIQALLFRSVRELLANVVKHSQASHVEVAISRTEDQIVICLEDDGVGFCPEEVVIGKDTGGFGLFSIRERLSQFGGALGIESKPGQGCRSILRAPLV